MDEQAPPPDATAPTTGAQAVTPQAPSAPVAAPTARVFSQDEVNRIVTERVARDRASRGAEMSRPAAIAAVDDMAAMFSLRDQLDDATGDLNLKASQRRWLRDQVVRDRPTDVPAYVASLADMIGWNLTAPAVAPTQPGPAASTPQLPPINLTPPVTGRPAASPVVL